MVSQKRHQKVRLDNDCGRSAGLTEAARLVWYGLTGYRDPNLLTNSKSCVIKSTYI